MRSEEQDVRLERFQALCREQGLSRTVHRRVILQAVLEREDHPTADQVYEAVKGRLPGVSRTTVYRVLDTLVRLGVVAKVCHPGPAARFDPKIDQHHHLVCLRCARIVDVEDERLNAIVLPLLDTVGFEISEFHIHLRGVCPACRRNRTKAGRQTSAARRRRKTDGPAKPSATKSSPKKRRIKA